LLRAYEKVEYILKSHQPQAFDKNVGETIDKQVQSEFKEFVE
jgi:trimethylamine:corrinoid methyltransferase-like protein